jgi:asparagine synthase (glutamine-hydrolysing)
VGGIIGKLSFDQDETLARPVLEQMLDAVAHRGGSRRNIYAAPGIALGSTDGPEDSAAPSDLRTSGPSDLWTSAPSHLHVVVDADLTNARELRAELRREGAEAGPGDAALVAHAYAVWGERCVARFDGGFACAIWDARTRRLLLARDHAGIKPLYFAFLHGHGIVFASALRALFHDPGVERTCCPQAIDAYLTLGYIPAPLTPFERISKLEPAQLIVVEGRRLHAGQYWDLPAARPARSIDDTVHQLESHLRMATRDQGIDPGCGVLYSGGTGSAALLSGLPHGVSPVITVALEQEVAEIARAHAAGQHLGRVPEVEVVSVETPVLASDLAGRFDEPIADPSAVTQYATCVAARQHVDIAVTGHGATALFDVGRRATVWDDTTRRAIYTRTFAWQVRDTDPRAQFRELSAARASGNPHERSRYVQIRSVLPDSTLAIAERAGLAAGLTLRFPWIDRRVMEFAATIPPSLGHERLTDVPLLRRLLARRLPASLMPPLADGGTPSWLQAALPAMVPAVLLAPRFDGRGIVSRPALRQLWEEHRGGRHDHSFRFWSLLMLEFWFREYIDGDAAEQPLEYAILKAA